tara:strand:- start:376 stop:477 length:102 start_codon:yes stop_codon:yes gene_type:complete
LLVVGVHVVQVLNNTLAVVAAVVGVSSLKLVSL